MFDKRLMLTVTGLFLLSASYMAYPVYRGLNLVDRIEATTQYSDSDRSGDLQEPFRNQHASGHRWRPSRLDV